MSRSKEGKFLPGTSGNPLGRPVGRKAQIDVLKQELEIAVRDKLKPQRIINILEKMCSLAEKGDVKAAKLVLSLAVSPAAASSEAAEERGTIQIVIENATFAAKPAATIEAKVIEEDNKNAN